MTYNCICEVHDKASTGAENEKWERLGEARMMLRILTAGQAINESVRLDNRNVTHDAICRWDSTLMQPGRILVRTTDRNNYEIIHVTEHGHAGRSARWRYMRILLSEMRKVVVE